MKTPDRTAAPLPGRSDCIWRRAAWLAALAVGAVGAQAQDVWAPAPVADVVPQALQQAQAAQNDNPSVAVPVYAPDTPLLVSGPVTVRAHVLYRILYGDGVPTPGGQRESTTIQNFAPELLVDLGRHWALDYTPSWSYYSNSAYDNSVDQSVRLSGWATYQDWTLQLAQNYNTSTAPSIETGEQTKQVNWSNNFSAFYSINSAMGLELTAQHAFQSAENFTSSHEWSTADWLHFKFDPHLDTAAGLGYGLVDVNQGTDMTYLRPQAQVTWSLTHKVSVNVHGGVERRHFQSSNLPGLTNPIYGTSITLQPIETTRLTIGAEHAVATSLFENVITKSTIWRADVEQRLLTEFYLSAGVSHEKVDYLPLTGTFVTARGDNNYSLNASLSTTLFRRCSVAAVFHNTRNSSTLDGFGVSSRQIGLEIGYRY
jgi:hypothetical protein